MCIRYCLRPETEKMKEIAGLVQKSKLYDSFILAGSAVLTSGEIGPGNVVPVIAPNRRGKPTVFPMRWGFRAPGTLLLPNAKLESIKEATLFQDSWKKHRCIVPASWYYEWKQGEDGFGQRNDRNRFMIQPRGEMETWLCGIYRFEGTLPVFAILTGKATKELRKINDRMPVMLPRALVKEWIRPGAKPDELLFYALTEMIVEKAG